MVEWTPILTTGITGTCALILGMMQHFNVKTAAKQKIKDDQEKAEREKQRKTQLLRIGKEEAFEDYDMASKDLLHIKTLHDLEVHYKGSNDIQQVEKAKENFEAAREKFKTCIKKYNRALLRLAQYGTLSDAELAEVMDNDTIYDG